MSDSDSNQFYVVGGTVPPESPSYIERKADKELYDHLRAGDFCYVLTSRQVGKSSLMARVARRLQEEQQAVVAILDLTQLGTDQDKAAADRWFYGVARKIQRELEISCDLQSWWSERIALPSLQRLSEFFSDVVLAYTSNPVVIFVDEIDTTIGLPFASDFFAAIRASYNERASKPQFRRLTFVLLGVASPSDLISDPRRTPFNIGYRIKLEDFTFEKALPLTDALPYHETDRERLLRQVFYWTNGHPYLTQRILSEIAAQNISEVDERAINAIVNRVFIEPPLHEAEQNIAYIRKFLTAQTTTIDEIKETYRLVRLGHKPVDDYSLSPVKSALKLSGLLKVNRAGQLIVRNRIYERAFIDWENEDILREVSESHTVFPKQGRTSTAVQFTTAKIVLLGDSGVGKTGLGWRLAHHEFKEHSTTHGQQFWLLPELGTRRADGTECEAILWDLAGQPDYRLTHALFLDDADLALVLFDPTDSRDPLHGVEFWLKQLKAGRTRDTCPTILVGARADRGEARLTQDELEQFCRQRDISGGYIAVSAKEAFGLQELIRRIKNQIPWDEKSATVTTVTFKRIRDYVLSLKENHRRKRVIVSPKELRRHLERSDKTWKFTEAEMMASVGHLANYGYVQVLSTSQGENLVLLTPELLNNLAASFVLEARRNPKGLGTLEEKRLLGGAYAFRELEKLSPKEQEILLDAAAILFLKHNICFRETDPLGGKSYLVFPELINLKKPPLEDEQPTEDGVAYTVSGSVENVYASLVVLLGYTQTFTRMNQWQSQARYVMGDGSICGFRQESNQEGELELVLYFGANVPKPGRKVFEGLFESFLARRNVNVFRYEPVVCPNGHKIERAVVRERLRGEKGFAFCAECGEKVVLRKADEPIQLTPTERRKVEEQRWYAGQRTRFEQAVFQLVSYVESRKLDPPKCFISYAWGDKEQERWVERNLATDLQKAGVNVVLDKWESERVGGSVMRFVEHINECDKVIVVGTPAYRKKYANRESEKGFVVAAEGDLIAPRMLSTEGKKASVLPLLLAGDAEESLPPWLHGRVYADFRNERAYFITAFNLMLSLYGISFNNPAVADLRESLSESEIR